jgi:hypothetical protein
MWWQSIDKRDPAYLSLLRVTHQPAGQSHLSVDSRGPHTIGNWEMVVLSLGLGREHPKHGSGLGMAVSPFGLARRGQEPHPDLAAVNPKP